MSELKMSLERARALPIEAGLLGRTVAWKGGGKGIERCGPCPVCGGDDRFSVNSSKRVWHCRGCAKGGDVIALAMHCGGMGFRESLDALVGIRESISAPGITPIQRRAHSLETNQRKLAMAAEIVQESLPLGVVGETFFREARRIDTSLIRDVLERGDALRWHPRVYFNQPGHELHRHFLGCIVSIMTDARTATRTGAISRTYLDGHGHKVAKAKTLGSPAGIVRLSQDQEVEKGLFLCEGLETGLTAMALGLRPMWCAGSTSVMRNFPVLSGIESLTVIADHDLHGSGQTAAREVGARWREAGREVRIILPDEIGDLNDLGRPRC